MVIQWFEYSKRNLFFLFFHRYRYYHFKDTMNNHQPNDYCYDDDGDDESLIVNIDKQSNNKYMMAGFSRLTLGDDDGDSNCDNDYNDNNNDNDDDEIMNIQITKFINHHHHQNQIDISKLSIDQFNNFLMDQQQQQQQKHYHHHYDYDNDNHQPTTINRLFKCPICLKEMKKLFCSNCIRNGDFTHSKKNFLERFADKKLKFIKLKEQQLSDCNDVEIFLKNDVAKNSMVSFIYSFLEISFLLIDFSSIRFTHTVNQNQRN